MEAEHLTIRVLCVDDHPLFREGIATVIGHQPDMALAGMAASGTEAIRQFATLMPDVTLMDLRLPDISGIKVTESIIAAHPHAKIVVLTTSEGDVEMERSLGAGARGYLLKGTPSHELIDVIRRVHRGQSYIPQYVAQQLAQNVGSDTLSAREVEVLTHVANGSKNREIGRQLSITEETVKAHVSSIIEKLGAKDRTQAVAIGVRRGIIQL